MGYHSLRILSIFPGYKKESQMLTSSPRQEEPIGPHPVAMFEVNIFTPAQFGAFIPWLVINRGPLSALIHPNCIIDKETGAHDVLRDHTQRATWMGERIPLDFGARGFLPRKEFENQATGAESEGKVEKK